MAGSSDLCAPVDGYVGQTGWLLMALLFSVTAIPTIGIEYSSGSPHSRRKDAFNYRQSS